eukprot:c20370_g1_i6.p1 GENE.c20370_g1_i6~~c20370_g1_i6.p1  ORF type:complete len:265 (+),score=42.04 c20370_g1_i6:370-1164(+)
MFEEINSDSRDCKTEDIDPDNPRTWENCNWPKDGKFMVQRPALHPVAFENRTNPNVISIFQNIFETSSLRCTIDNWGVNRGTLNDTRKEWRNSLQPHWDYNPWLWLHEVEQGINPGFQGLVALRDNPLGTGCHTTLPCGTRFLPIYCNYTQNPFSPHSFVRKSHRPEPHHPMCRLQQIPLRKGELLLWSWGQLHGNSPNTSVTMRLVQFIRLYPHPDLGPLCSHDSFDRYAATKILNDPDYGDDARDGAKHLDARGREIVGLDE